MNITYCIQESVSGCQYNTIHSSNTMKNAMDYFEYYCNLYPNADFKMIKREMLDEIIVESKNKNQKTFDFI